MASPKLEQLLASVRGKKRVIICTHNNPDPDSLASAVGLKALLEKAAGIHGSIRHGGVIGRASNQAMVAQCRIDVRPARKKVSRTKDVGLALVDGQPGPNTIVASGNRVDIVLDHHAAASKTKGKFPVGHLDLRPDYGSCGAIVYEYLKAAEVPIDKRLATAMFYGIQTDIGELGRERSDPDMAALAELFPMASQRLLAMIQSPRLPRDYYHMLSWGLAKAVIHRDVVVARLGNRSDPDIVAELADFVLRMKGMRWSLICGLHDGGVQFSLRTTARNARAGRYAVRLAGRQGSAGGHHRSAGGWVDAKDVRGVDGKATADPQGAIVAKFLKMVHRTDTVPQALWPEEDNEGSTRP